jgi:hypothetical protein
LALACAYAVVSGGDFYPGTRYIAWVWPVVWALAAAATAVWGLPRRWASAAMVACVLSSYTVFWSFPGLMQGGWSEARQRVEIAESLDASVAPGERVACAWAGSFYFFSDVAGIDVLGKSDRTVASRAPDPALGPSAHNKMDLGYSLGVLKPEWVLMVPPGTSGAAWLHSGFDAALWNNPLFQGHCAGEVHAVGGPWALCRCRWS